MKLSNSNIKKILIFSQKKAFLIFPEMEPCTFQSKLEKEEKSIRRKFYYTSRNVNPEKTSDIFSKESFFLYSGKWNSYISGNRIF